MLCSTGNPVWHSAMTWRAGMGEAQGGGVIGILTAGSCSCTAETKTTL